MRSIFTFSMALFMATACFQMPITATQTPLPSITPTITPTLPPTETPTSTPDPNHLTEGLPATPDQIVKIPAELCTPEQMTAWAIEQDEKLPDFAAKVTEFMISVESHGVFGRLRPELSVDSLENPQDYPVRHYTARCEDYYSTNYPELSAELSAANGGVPVDDALVVISIWDTPYGRLASMIATDWYVAEGTNARGNSFPRMQQMLGEQRFQYDSVVGGYPILLPTIVAPDYANDYVGSTVAQRVRQLDTDKIKQTADVIDKMQLNSTEDLAKMQALFNQQVFTGGASWVIELPDDGDK